MLTTVVSFILVLGFLVFVHELGHYLAARHVGVRVERFSIGFPPKAFGKTIGETEYVLSWIPLGGYVKLYGQNIDDEDPNDPRNYAAKSKLQRLYILAAGPAMNLIAAVLLMAVVYMLGVQTPDYRLTPPFLAGVEQGSPAAESGFQPGDRIIALEGAPIHSWKELFDTIEQQAIRHDRLQFQVERSGHEQTLLVDPTAFMNGGDFGWEPVIPPVVGSFGEDSPAQAAGMQVGDRIVAVNGKSIITWGEVPGAIQATQGRPVEITVERQGGEHTYTVTPRFDAGHDRWLIHIALGMHTVRHNPVEALVLGTKRLTGLTESTLVFLGRLLTGQGSLNSLGGPVKIGVVIGQAARTGAVDLIFLMSFISLQLGIFNLLPIPALDGGHMFMIGLETVNRAPLSARLRERTQMIGLSLLLLLILFVTYNDVLHMVTGGRAG
ncbi:MAG TPA: RIP metalloprotease RseP [bacterium]|nr:RIP metalloprotease RseP [bacterium]